MSLSLLCHCSGKKQRERGREREARGREGEEERKREREREKTHYSLQMQRKATIVDEEQAIGVNDEFLPTTFSCSVPWREWMPDPPDALAGLIFHNVPGYGIGDAVSAVFSPL